jgi:hypothetical protein
VARTFLYRKAKPGFSLKNLDLSKEVTIANALKRNFWWYESCLWAQDLSCPAVVVLSGKDRLVPSVAVKAYVERSMPQARVVFWDDMGHGQLLMTQSRQEELKVAMEEEGLEAVSMSVDTEELIVKLTASLAKRLGGARRQKPCAKTTTSAAGNNTWELSTKDALGLLGRLEEAAPKFDARRKLRTGMFTVVAANRVFKGLDYSTTTATTSFAPRQPSCP